MATQGEREEMDNLSNLINYDQAQSIKQANLINLVNSVREFTGDVRVLECFIQRMDQLHELIESARLDEASTKNLQGVMLSKIDIELLLDLGLSFASTWSEAKLRLKERFRSATKTAGRIAWRMVRMSRGSAESLVGFSHRVSDAFRQTKDRVVESSADNNTVAVKLQVYEELAMETLTHELPERLKAITRTEKPKTIEDLNQLIREEELEREEQKSLGYRRESRSYAETTRRRNLAVRVVDPRSVWGQTVGLKTHQQKEDPWKCVNREERKESRFLCWECGAKGHLARNCRYRTSRRQRRDKYQDRRHDREPMEVNAIAQEDARQQRPRLVVTGRRRTDPETESSDLVSSDDDSVRKIINRKRVSGESHNPGDSSNSRTVIQEERPWRQKKD